MKNKIKLTVDDLYQIAAFNRVVKNYLKMVKIVIPILLCVCLLGCGSRKVTTNITSNKAVQDTKEHETAQSTEINTTKQTDAKTSTETNTSEGASTTNVKKYDANTGKLIEERTTVSNKKKAGTKQQAENKTLDVTNYHLVNMERVITTHVTVKEYTKSKKSDTSNKPLYWMLFGIGCVGILVWGTVKRFKR